MSLAAGGSPLELGHVGAAEESAPAPATAADLAALPAMLLGLTIAVFTDIREVEPLWRAFELIAHRTAFQAFDWIARWQQHVGVRRGARPAIVVGRTGADEIAFILPFAVEKGRAARRLTWLASEVCDYNAPLVSAEAARTDWKALWPRILDAIRADRRLRFDLVDLGKMPADIDGAPNPLLALRTTRHADDAHVATLGDDWERFYQAKRSSATRKVQRRHMNRLADIGALRFLDALEPDEAARTLDALMAQKQRALARMGVADMFARPGLRDFYRDIATDPALSDWVHVTRYDVGEEVGAASIGLVHRGRYCLILSSYNDGPMSDHGPGRAHLHELMRYAIDRGLKEFDFTIGSEPYKLDWSDIRVPLHDHAAAASFRGALAMPVMAAAHGAKRFIKNNGAAWHAFETMRSRLGGIFRRPG